jgi:hypothetical protein
MAVVISGCACVVFNALEMPNALARRGPDPVLETWNLDSCLRATVLCREANRLVASYARCPVLQSFYQLWRTLGRLISERLRLERDERAGRRQWRIRDLSRCS